MVSGMPLTRVLEQADLIFLRGLHLANGVGRLGEHFVFYPLCDLILLDTTLHIIEILF